MTVTVRKRLCMKTLLYENFLHENKIFQQENEISMYENEIFLHENEEFAPKFSRVNIPCMKLYTAQRSMKISYPLLVGKVLSNSKASSEKMINHFFLYF